MLDQVTALLHTLGAQTGLDQLSSGNLVMIAVGAAILALVTSIIALIFAAFPLLKRLRSALSMRIAHREAARKAAEQAAIPEEHVAAISATIAAIVGAHRIVRIERAHHGLGWQAEGRAAHHGSHALSHPGTSHNQGNNHGTEVQNHSRGAAI